jgi:hypothetical protein
MNCRGCGRPEAIHKINSVVDRNHPKALFLSETRMSATCAKDLCQRMGFRNAFGVSS